MPWLGRADTLVVVCGVRVAAVHAHSLVGSEVFPVDGIEELLGESQDLQFNPLELALPLTQAQSMWLAGRSGGRGSLRLLTLNCRRWMQGLSLVTRQ